jgi:hypothetical protein
MTDWPDLYMLPEERDVPPKCPLTFTGLHGVISKNTELSTVTAVRTLNPATTCRYKDNQPPEGRSTANYRNVV